ncbi:flagellar assembly peptidoglycan hydrolase FlgJ [Massilia sp. Leaf139]|uniref:flagellar assembly peptidoglycan hydrolase FlgJ n=1 Tax=Massilia sp. Leaf139 TaxID=1736272 RepID=UPI000700875A|nr:flagellar assembly peptidoglycan hydrolase FlgJ [Massilia sp. Leaf139]KQQ91602.1 flagellar biosynthesis protein FlgJ [Massilia sp. Leaf139]
MRHADFSTTAISATLPTAPTRPTAAIGGGSGFGRAFAEVQGDVADFIQNGGGASAPELSPEGSMWRARSAAEVIAAPEAEGGSTGDDQQAFLDNIAPWAREAAAKLGVAPELVQAHAALESGWGQRPIRNAGGESSHNLFGIKATGKWDGAVAESATTEYVGGAAVKTKERFRAYPDGAAAFRDYAQMLLDNPRYKGAIGAGNDANAFAQGLAKGGYATDPAYAAKLARLAGKLQGING